MGNNAGNKTGTCVFCGAEGEITADHVPPKGLFPKLIAGDPLITIPACLSCNGGTSADDEYFRDLMAARADSYDHRHSAEARARTVRSFARPEAKGKKAAFEQSIVTTREGKRGAISIEDVVAIMVSDGNLERLHRTMRETIRGLYWHETNRLLPQDTFVQAIRDDQARIWKGAPYARSWLEKSVWRDIREGTFSYRYRVSDIDPNFSVWHFSFYSGPSFLTGGLIEGPKWYGATMTTTMKLEEAFHAPESSQYEAT